MQARLWLRLADEQSGPWSLPPDEAVSVGRAPSSGLRLPRSWVPRGLCRLVPTGLGWLVQVGPRARARVQNDFVGDHVFDRLALVALQPGKSVITFPELDDLCQLGIRIVEPALENEANGLAPALELRDRPDKDERARGTIYAVRRVAMTRTQRQRAAVTFRHLLCGEPAPKNLTQTAAAALGISEQALKNSLGDLRDKVNEERWLNLSTYEQLGHYLCHLSRNLQCSDLPEAHQ